MRRVSRFFGKTGIMGVMRWVAVALLAACSGGGDEDIGRPDAGTLPDGWPGDAAQRWCEQTWPSENCLEPWVCTFSFDRREDGQAVACRFCAKWECCDSRHPNNCAGD